MTEFECAHHNYDKRIDTEVKNNSKAISFAFCCHLRRPTRPPWMHFLPARRFLLVLCPSLVMDSLSAISQSNHIQRCSSSRAACFKDDAALHFLFAPPVLLLHVVGVSSIDFQLFSFWVFLFFLPYTLRLLSVFVTRNLHFKGSWNNHVG